MNITYKFKMKMNIINLYLKLQNITIKNNQKILDIGCGNGSLLMK